MRRQVSLEEISDGRLYDRRDMVRVGCGGCRGCSECCRGMGKSAILDPMDIYRLAQGTGVSMDELLSNKLELNVVDGIILPCHAMNQENDACGFLNEEGRCSIHPFRPGICRLFPLGRYYVTANARETQSANSFHYFIQVHECPAPNKTKVRIEKWLEQPELARYEAYILKWHNFLAQAEIFVREEPSEDTLKNFNLCLLSLFFMKSYDLTQDFYGQFEERLAQAEKLL